MHALTSLGAALAATVALTGCAPRQSWDPRTLGDLVPPTLLGIGPDATGWIEMRFDEPVALVEGSLLLEPAAEDVQTRTQGTSLLVGATQTPGREYRLEATVEDSAGNSGAVVARFYGHNPEVPRLLINELTTRGSGSHPDLVELCVLSDGDIAGVVLYQGTPSDWSDRIVFPACRVARGEYLVIHFRPEGTPDERDEVDALDASGGADAGAARDFWVSGGQGLSGNNGVLSLYSSPGGSILDGFLYSDRTSDSDSIYAGFGSASVLARARELAEHGGWVAANGSIRPEDAVSPEGSTATRSIARGSAGIDTNTREDWHITPTRGATWGAPNTDERYVAPARKAPATRDP